ncbi:MAG: hypothetical protein IT494_04385 [Gammaproteobacteria bacterium]|nr:hypothetical protein [Gammaproteobacteria bacterium]
MHDEGSQMTDHEAASRDASSALLLALVIQRRAAMQGFDWRDAAGPLAKISEEQAELASEIANGATPEVLSLELGDLLFSCVNLARHLAIDPEQALRRCCEKFQRRFAHIERSIEGRGLRLDAVGIDELERLWQEAKRDES